MRVFLTGASGFIGQAVIAELKGAGHEVVGLARNDDNVARLAAVGVAAHRGDFADPASLAAGAATCEATIHCAFIHDFSRYAENIAIDRRAVEAMLAALEGSAKPFVLTSGTLMADGPGEVTEAHAASGEGRGATEHLVEAWPRRGGRGMIVRLPQVHDEEKQGFVSLAVQVALAKGVSAYVGDGANRWAAAHVGDVARLYRLALENGQAGARYHAVGESGVPMCDIAEAIDRRFGLPVVSIPAAEAPAHFGFLGGFAVRDAPTSNRLTRERLAWTPVAPASSPTSPTCGRRRLERAAAEVRPSNLSAPYESSRSAAPAARPLAQMTLAPLPLPDHPRRRDEDGRPPEEQSAGLAPSGRDGGVPRGGLTSRRGHFPPPARAPGRRPAILAGHPAG